MRLKSFLLPALSSAMAILALTGCKKDELRPGGEQPEVTASVTIIETTRGSVSFSVDATEGAEAAWLLATTGEVTDAWGGIPNAESVFSVGEAVEADAYPATVETAADIEPEVEYTLAVAARKDGVYSEVVTATFIVDRSKNLSLVSSSKTSFTYRIIAEQNQIWHHTYFEKTFYEEVVKETIKSTYGEDLTEQQILQYALADFGYLANGEETTWTAGDDNSQRGEYARANIVGGQDYMAVAAPYDAQTQSYGTVETIDFSTPEPDRSTATVSVSVSELDRYGMKTVITPGENIRFYFYLLVGRDLYDAAIAQYGEDFFEDYLKNYGYVSYYEYTDVWSFSDPGEPYLLLVLGVDMNGDVVMHEEEITPPPVLPEINVSVVPYDSETGGSWHGYESLWTQVGFDNFEAAVNPGTVMFGVYPESEIDAMGGIGYAMENIGALVSSSLLQPLPVIWPDLAADLETNGNSFSGVITGYNFGYSPLEPDSGYYMIVALRDENTGEVTLSGYGYGKTAKEPASGEDAGYQAYLGEWTLSGQSTGADWGAPVTYDLRIEQLVENYSFLVYGWSGASFGEEHPFIMNYNPDTQGVYVMAPQHFGSLPEDPESELVFGGLILYGATDYLTFCYDAPEVIFEGSLQGDALTLFGRTVDVQGVPYDYRSMNYVALSSDLSGVSRLDGAESDAIYFRISRK